MVKLDQQLVTRLTKRTCTLLEKTVHQGEVCLIIMELMKLILALG